MKLSFITPVLAALLLTAGSGMAHFGPNGGDVDWNGGGVGPNDGGVGPNGGGSNGGASNGGGPSFQTKKLDNLPFGKVQRKRHPMRLDFSLFARDHQILENPDGSNSIIVREDSAGPADIGHSISPGTGLPNLGLRKVKVLIPYEASFKGLQLRILKEETESLGFFEIAPVGAISASSEDENGNFVMENVQHDGVQLDDVGRDMMVYSSDTAWPSESLNLSGVGCYRALRYAVVMYAPFRWNPNTGQLTKVTSVRAVLAMNPRPPLPFPERDLELGDPVALQGLALWRMLASQSSLQSYMWPLRDDDNTFLIITTDLIYSNPASHLGAFVIMKLEQGFDVRVKLVEDIDMEYPNPTHNRAHSIRAFLMDRYQAMGVKNVLLIGDPNPDDQTKSNDPVGDVPMLLAWPFGGPSHDPEYIRPVATDMFYGDLTRFETLDPEGKGINWDSDGNGYPGERNWDYMEEVTSGPGATSHTQHFDSDFVMDVNVARIPFGDLARVSKHLDAQVEHQSAVVEVPSIASLIRSKVVLSMAEFHGPASGTELYDPSSMPGMNQLGGLIVNMLPEVCIPFEQYQFLPFAGPYGDPLTEESLPDALDAYGAGLVVWSGPGTAFKVKMNQGLWSEGFGDWHPFIESTDASEVNTNITRSIVIATSGHNADPNRSTNLIHEFLEHASVGAIANTGRVYGRKKRIDFGELTLSADNSYIAAQALLSGETLGCAVRLARSKGTSTGKDMSGDEDSVRCQPEAYCLMALNAFGDPTLSYGDPSQSYKLD